MRSIFMIKPFHRSQARDSSIWLGKIARSALALALVFCAVTSQAEQKRFGDHVVYYNVFNSSFLTPKIARAYGIPRSGQVAVINIAVRKELEGSESEAVPANVFGKVTDRLSKVKELGFKEVREDGAVYYLANFRFNDKDVLTFNFDVQIGGEGAPKSIAFQQQLFRD